MKSEQESYEVGNQISAGRPQNTPKITNRYQYHQGRVVGHVTGASRKANTNNPEQTVHLINPIIQTGKYETLSDL